MILFLGYWEIFLSNLGKFRRFHGENLGDLWSFKEKIGGLR